MRTLNDYFLHATIADISTGSSTFVPVPDGGKIIKIITALQGAITSANAGISPSRSISLSSLRSLSCGVCPTFK